MRDPRWIGAISLFFLVSVAAPAGAQEAEGGGEQEGEQAQEDEAQTAVERARDHMERGQALYLQARFEEAAAEFEAAYEAQPFSAFLFNAGAALERAGQATRAAEFFEQYLTRDPDAADADAVRARVARLRAAASAGTSTGSQDQPDAVPDEFKSLVSVRTTPEGATVRVLREGTEVANGPAPFAHTLDAGRYLLRVEHPDFQTVEQSMRVEPGKVYVVIVEMSQGEFLGYLRVVTNVPGADVYIDDREQGARGQTPFEAPIATGQHTIWIERPGYREEETQAEVNVGEDVTVRVDLTRVDFGRLRVVANITGARVIVDDQLMGTVPYEGELGAGPHRVRIESDGMKSFEEEVNIRQGQLTPMRVRLRPDVGRGGAWVSTVFAALLLGGGITLAVIGNDFMSQVQSEIDNGTLATDDSRLDTGLFLWIGADAAFGLTLIVGALALYYFLYDDLPPSEGQVLEPRDWAFTPLVDPQRQTAGLGFTGRF